LTFGGLQVKHPQAYCENDNSNKDKLREEPHKAGRVFSMFVGVFHLTLSVIVVGLITQYLLRKYGLVSNALWAASFVFQTPFFPKVSTVFTHPPPSGLNFVHITSALIFTVFNLTSRRVV